MGGKSDVFENDLLKLIFHGTPIANIADNAAASPLTTLYLALHTSDPLDTALTGQTTNETSYTGYARKAMTRDNSAWTITGNSVSPAADVDFNECTAGAAVAITHVTIGTAASGDGKVLYSGAITPALVVSAGSIPRITSASALTED